MKISVVTPNFNGERHLSQAVESVIAQRGEGLEVEYIVVDGGSTDRSMEIIERYRKDIDVLVSERDEGPADALNKGMERATGEVLGWINADDFYYPGALKRVAATMRSHRDRALCFGHCPIVDGEGKEIRGGITRFKEAFYPLASHFAIQCINFVSQPAMFFRREAWEKARPLRTDMVAAWDYDLLLKLWRQGGAVRVGRPPLAAFRWHEGSISGRHFRTQFREEWQIAAADAGKVSLQSVLHLAVWWGIVASYSAMAFARDLRKRRGEGSSG